MKINSKLRGKLPQVAPPLPWQTKDGLRNGWKVTIPGRRLLATPAVADGRLFLGGGFGSYDFYALDAATGHVLWQYQTEDDGPTAAVVHEGDSGDAITENGAAPVQEGQRDRCFAPSTWTSCPGHLVRRGGQRG